MTILPVNSRISAAAAFLTLFMMSGCGGSGGGVAAGNPPPDAGGLSTGPAACTGGDADGFACSGITLRARVPHADLGGTRGNDIWGWADPDSGNEYAIVGMTNGTAFVDVTDPEAPVYLGRLATPTRSSTWRDIKVYGNHAYIVADDAGSHGMQVFDLTRLRGIGASQLFDADVSYSDFDSAHNIAINEDTGFAYVVGSNTCNEGLHMIDIRVPNNPMFAGCHADFDVHDAQCVIYAGPDADYAGREICASSAGAVVEFADVSDKFAPLTIAIATYPQRVFVHQAWLTEDQQFLLVGDELDEIDFGVPTRTHVFDVRDLDAPAYVGAYEGPTRSIDHNLYVRGNRVYEANYTSGLQVLEFGDLANLEVSEVAFFDTYPANDATVFDGAWSAYPYLPSGNIIVNDTANGLFVLTEQ